MARYACILAAFGLAAVRAEDHWAVLVAGSNGFYNYRHQADVCHAYKVLVHRGIHPDHIITMMYDDVANSTLNPYPGKLFNFPWQTMEDAVDVYADCKIDYRGTDVTPEKFVAVLTGDAATAGGKVLKSKADDSVFVNFVDHGGVGVIAFPEGTGVLHSAKLVSTLEDMYQQGMYKQLAFYLETCESGSMFEDLLKPSLPVYAVTAANAGEPSFGTFCGDASVVAGKRFGTCLGDLFSVSWMTDAEQAADGKETLQQQFLRVQNLTNKSHVMQYGQVANLGNEPLSNFQGPGSAALKALPLEAGVRAGTVSSRDVALDYYYRAYLHEGTTEAAERLTAEIKDREAVKDLGRALSVSVLGRTLGEEPQGEVSWTDASLACHEKAVEAFGASCGWTDSRLVLSRTLFDLCRHVSNDVGLILRALRGACPEKAPADFYA